MSSQSPDSCSASNDFDENTVGRYGIQPYRFEPRVETVSSVDELEALEALREKTMIWISRRKSKTHGCKIRTGR